MILLYLYMVQQLRRMLLLESERVTLAGSSKSAVMWGAESETGGQHRGSYCMGQTTGRQTDGHGERQACGQAAAGVGA